MTLEYPDTGLVENFELYRRRRPTITLIVERDVVAPTLFRNTKPDRAETHEFNDTLHAQVNGEKFAVQERLTGLNLLRRLTDEYGDGDDDWTPTMDDFPDGLISPQYTYNEPGMFTTSLNLDTLTYGIAGTGDMDFGIKSRVTEGYTYSTESYNVMKKEVRNAVYESGTMQDEDTEQSTSLYEYAKVQPGNSFIHFIKLEAATPAMLLYTLHNILNTGTYGARETRTGKTIQNNIRGIILSNSDTALSTGELLMSYRTDGPIEEDIATYVTEMSTFDWELYGDIDGFEPFPDWYHTLTEVAGMQTSDAPELLYDEFHDLTTEALDLLLDTDD